MEILMVILLMIPVLLFSFIVSSMVQSWSDNADERWEQEQERKHQERLKAIQRGEI